MSRRYWGMGWSPSEGVAKMDATREATIDSMLNTPQAEKAGVTKEGLENIRRFRKPMRGDAPPTLSEGVASPAIVRGEQYQMVDHHTDGHGDRVIEMARPIGGGRFETIHVTESQASQHSRIVSRVRGR